MKSLNTSLRVLRAFTKDRSRWSVGALAEALGLNKSQVSKMLVEFREAGFLRQDPKTREYAVGIHALALAGNYLHDQPLVREAIVVMRRLTDETGQTSALAVLDGTGVLYLAALEGRHFLDVGWRVATWLPFHATAVGKVLFAFADDALVERAVAEVGLPRLSPNTICDPQALKAQFAKIRRSGVGETAEETMQGLGAQAVPILGEGQACIAALGLVYPIHIVSAAKRKLFRGKLHAAARSLSSKMGALVYPFGED
ncbi:MAG: IclR family transcriptional regulator [Rhodospirillaceae bacterium]|nr:IclR family transcriptional regulator [Rhodospirillaceae bacterium]